jgi:predicted secreted protein
MRDRLDGQEADRRGDGAEGGNGMKWTSIVAIYFLFFVGSAFVLLPFGIKTDEEVGNALVRGQAESAPYRFNLPKHLLRAAVLAAILTALFDLNYIFGWITPDDFDFYRRIFGD